MRQEISNKNETNVLIMSLIILLVCLLMSLVNKKKKLYDAFDSIMNRNAGFTCSHMKPARKQ